jgi:hypothetical protein
VAYSPDGTLLAGATAAGVVKVWEVKTGQVRATLSAPFAGPLAFTPDGKLLAAGHGDSSRSDPGPSSVTLWETATWRKRGVLGGHKGPIAGVDLSADGRTLASASRDGTIKLWPVPGAGGAVVVAAEAKGPVPIGEAAGPRPTRDVPGAPVPDAPEQAAQARTGRGWVAGVVLLGLVVTLSLAVWLYVRQGRRAAEAPVPASVPVQQARTEAAPVVFTCPGCGKGLKARAALAGKKVKCPRCGTAALVAAAEPGGAGRAPS